MSLEQTTNDKATLLTKLQRKMSLEERKLGKRLHAPLQQEREREGKQDDDNNNEQANLKGAVPFEKIQFYK